jgi:hypothetical protein
MLTVTYCDRPVHVSRPEFPAAQRALAGGKVEDVMKKFVLAISFMLALSAAAIRAEDKPAMPATPPAADAKEQTLTGQLFAKKKDAAADVVAAFKVEAKIYQLVAKDEETGKQIKALLNQKADVKGTIKDDTITVTSIEKKGAKK